MSTKTENLMESGSLWFPESIQSSVTSLDTLFYFILYLSIILFAGIVGAMLYFIIKYRRRENHQEALAQISHNTPIEIVWTVIPLLLCFVVFGWGYMDFLKFSTPPEDAKTVYVTGKKWLWQFAYPSGIQTIGELVVPVNTPIKLVMSSEDVLHSFFIPNVRMKRDVLPNRYTTIWFQAEKEGVFQVFCTEYCGDAHSQMLASLIVLPKEEYKAWVENGGSSGEDLPLEELGEKLYVSKGCNACHSLDGSKMSGPTWKGLYGANRNFTDGTSRLADDQYLNEAILQANARIVEGYQPVMPAYDSLLKERDVMALIEYIKTIK